MKKLLMISLIIVVSSCSTTPRNRVAALQATLTTLETTATLYARLPKCGTPNVIACKNPEVVKNIGIADNIAFNAIQSAKAITNDNTVQAAENAVNVFDAIVKALVTTNNKQVERVPEVTTNVVVH